MFKFINEIETKYNVTSIKACEEQVWPYIRLLIYPQKIIPQTSQKKKVFQHVKMAFLNLRNFFYGFKNWFGSYDVIVFSDFSERIPLSDGMLWDKTTDYIIEQIGEKNVLSVEQPLPFHASIKRLPHKNIVSYSAIWYFQYLFLLIKRVIRVKPVIENSELLTKINHEYKLNINFNKVIENFNSNYLFLKYFFKLYKPSTIIVNCAYGKMALIKAANDCGITTIEVQHGTIGVKHPAYYSSLLLEDKFYPNYLFTFGKHDVSNLIPKVKLAGSFYLDWIYKNKPFHQELHNLKKNYDLSVGITLQYTVENELINFIIEAATKCHSILFVFIPRLRDKTDFTKYNIPKNVIVWTKNNFYETITNLDIHSTVYSTCALEAPALGVQNILINIKGMAKELYSDRLKSSITQYADTVEEYIGALKSFEKQEPEQVITENRHNIEPGYQINVQKILKEIL